MATKIDRKIDRALLDLEALADEIRLKLHLAGMGANDLWTTQLEPRLRDARAHAREARAASKAAALSTLEALRDLRRAL